MDSNNKKTSTTTAKPRTQTVKKVSIANAVSNPIRTDETLRKRPVRTRKTITNESNFDVFKDDSELSSNAYPVYEETVESKTEKLVNSRGESKTITRYNTSIKKGLTSDIVEERTKEGFTNDVNKGSTKTIKKIIFSNIFTFFNILTFAIAGWLISVNSYKDLVFLFIVTLNVIIGILQEIRAKITIDKLSILSAPTANILRDGETYEIAVKEVVLDDILVLSNGKQIPADSIVLEGTIEVNESLLTGESDSILKRPGDELYSGSFVVSGNCKAQVNKVGKDNYIETLTTQAKKYSRPKSELLKSLNKIIRTVAIIIIPIGAMLFLMQTNLLENKNVDYSVYVQAVQKTAGAMIGMIPSGLFLLTSVALAVGVVRLSQNNTLVQELYCIEMLARVDCICLDKTGTITDGTMTVKGLIDYNCGIDVPIKNIISAMLNALNDNNMTSKALEAKFGRGKRIKHQATIPFSSQRKYSAVDFMENGTFVMGAPEFVLKENYSLVEKDVEEQAKEGYRVLVVAYTKNPIVNNEIRGILKPLCLILIEDTIRPDAVETLKYFKDTGVDIKVISGDNPITVSKVSQRAGIDGADKYISLDGLSNKEVEKVATSYTVFGRVSPTQKYILIKTLKSKGKTVAMTGDGVNDILALKEADCSIAMASGSEAARNVSQLVLLDSNFSSMPKVVAEGRRVINNIQKVSILFLTKTIFSFLLAVVALLRNGTYPISPSQLFMIDFLVIGAPSFFLALEPNDRKVVGKFLFNVLSRSIPGALVVIVNSIIIFMMEGILGLETQETSTLIVITATYTCMMVLFKVCSPFNILRRILFFCSFTAFICLTLFVPWIFDFTPFFAIPGSDFVPLELSSILLIICLCEAAYPLITLLQKSVPWLKKQISASVSRIAKS